MSSTAALVVAGVGDMDWPKVGTDAVRSAFGVPAAVYALAAVGLNVQYGYTGLLNFGHVGFLLVGAYGTAISVDQGAPLWLGVLVGILASVVLALVLGVPTLRLRADYLAVVTIAAAEILRYTVLSRSFQPTTGGTQGLKGFAEPFYRVNPIPSGRYGPGSITFNHRQLWLMVVAWGLVALFTVLLWLAARAPWGRVMRSIREDEDAARSLGKSVFSYKLQSLVLGGVIGALAGMVTAFDGSYVNPSYFLAVTTFYCYTVIILGGRGHALAPVVGAVLFWFLFQGLDTTLREAISSDVISSSTIAPTDIGAVQNAVVGLALMLLVVLVPQGIFGNKKELMVDER
ncbi:MAG TPA: branched-chain amino acid ABC transporter permease [Acidimicrobiales bacterium]|nr:branched-chain amino acid ABC transporter permease [Acidimicrobiales bacterium]